jgi:Holliday junction DNA helicase RuvA
MHSINFYSTGVIGIREILPEMARYCNICYYSPMIARIEGTIIHKTDKFLVVDVGGVGYKLFATADTLNSRESGEPSVFWTYTAVRENSLDLYGFTTIEEMSFFELLLDVSGIGPKSALAILSVASIDTLKKAIATGDTSYLNKVSGIGRKTAEKIVIELRDKLAAHKGEEGAISPLRGESDVVEALKSLGYSQNDARDVMKKIPHTIEGTNARIKEALKILGGK